jgi:putative ABC transport system permease protein
MQVQVAGRRFTDPQVTQQFFQRALDAVRAVPGVSEAALSSQLPLSGDSDIYGVRFESSETPETSADGGAYRYAVSEGYFDVMGIPLLAGRTIAAHDRAGSIPVVVINESFAKRRFPGRDPIGQRLHLGPVDREWFTIVGVVGDIKQESLSAGRFDAAYISPSQWHFADRAFWIVIKTRATAAAVAPPIRQAIWSVDKDQPVVRVAMMSDLVTATAGQRRFALLLFQLFGITALLLTAIGIYGVVSGGVNERIREIGVRTALGASRRSILSMVLKQGVALAAIGIALGAIVAAASSRGLSALLFGISPLDPVSYAAVAILLMGVTIAACWWPARRAARVDPSVTLRAE